MESLTILLSIAFSAMIGFLALSLPELMADPGGPKLFPLTVSIMILSSCFLLVLQRLILNRGHIRISKGYIKPTVLIRLIRKYATQGCVIILVFLFPLAIQWIGFMPAILIFSFTTMFVSGKSLFASLIAAIAITVSTYIAYVVVLGAVLPKGELIYYLLY